MRSFLITLLLGVTTSLSAHEVFLTERGTYDYTLNEVAKDFGNYGLKYLTLNPQVQKLGKYKLNKRREFQIKDWFKQDWYKLQDMFKLDEVLYRDQFGGTTFVESKRLAHSRWQFNEEKKRHLKTHPTMREWGGLNHPPIKKLSKPLSFYAREQGSLKEKTNKRFYDPIFHQKLDKISSSELSFGNKLTLLADHKAFDDKLKLIKNAKESIFMGALVFVCDQGTREITKALIEKKKQGLDVRILADATVSKYLGHRECLNLMKANGIEVIQGDDFWNYNGRAIYHSKMLVVDLKTAIIGGHNMIDADNLSRGVDFKNRDVDLKVMGPMVTDVAEGFLRDWEHFFTKKFRTGVSSVREIIQVVSRMKSSERIHNKRGRNNYSNVLSGKGKSQGVCRFIRQAPYEDVNRIGKVYLEMLKATESYVALTNAVFADTKVTSQNRMNLSPIEWTDSFEMYNQIFTQLQSMLKRGMKMDFVTTNFDMSGNENVVVFNESIKHKQEEDRDWASNWDLAKIFLSNAYYGNPHYRNLLTDWVGYKNLNIWNHISFMHSKVVHFDRLSASVGSYNIQHNATDHAFEVTTICQDDGLNQQIDRMFVEDMVNSIPLIFK